MIERIIEWMDEYYLINLSTEVKRGMTEKLSRGEALCPPAYGYDIQDGKYIINSDEAPHIIEIFNDFLSGLPMRQIALKCAAKVSGPTGEIRLKLGLSDIFFIIPYMSAKFVGLPTAVQAR